MENKYYTPKPKDIRIGFELERKRWIEGNHFTKHYFPIVIDHDVSITNILNDLKNNSDTVRVPYLTPEQILNENFKITGQSDLSIIFVKGSHVFHYGYNGHYLTVLKGDEKDTVTLFMGKCRCINDLRTIFEMLNIK